MADNGNGSSAGNGTNGSDNGTQRLSARIPAAVQLTGLVGQLREGIAGVEVPDLPLDSVMRLAGRFDLPLPDTSAWSQIITPSASGLLSGFPDAETLTGPLSQPLRHVRRITEFDFRAELARIEAALVAIPAPSTENAPTFLRSLIAPLGQVNDMITGSELTGLLSALGSLTGVGELTQAPQDLSNLLRDIQSFLEQKVAGVVLGLAAISSAATLGGRAERAVQAAAGWFSLEATTARFDAIMQAYGSGAGGLAASLRGVQWSDPVAVDALRVRLRDAGTAFTVYHTSLVRDFAFTEASLALIDAASLRERFAQIERALAAVDPQQLAALADALRGVLERVRGTIRFDGDVSVDRLKAMLRDGIAQARAEVDKLDPSGLVEGFQGFFGAIDEPLKRFQEFKVQIEALVRDVFGAIEEAIRSVDIAPVRQAFDQGLVELERKVAELDSLFAEVRGAIHDTFEQVKQALGAARDALLSDNGVKKQIEDLFGSLFDLLDGLHIDAALEQVRQVLQPIAAALAQIQFGPIIDATVDAIDAIKEVLEVVGPLLVTDALKDKLGEAADFLRQIDLGEIRGELLAAFNEIRRAVDTEALGRFQEEYDKVVDAVGQLDPRPALQALQEEVFTPLVNGLESIHPVEILAPVQEAFDTAAEALNGFNPTETLSFLRTFFEDLKARLAEVSPSELLQPVEDALADVRTTINNALPLEQALAAMDAVTGYITPVFEAVDASAWLDQVATGYAGLRDMVGSFDPAEMFAPVAGLLRDLFARTGLDLNTAGLADLFMNLRVGTLGLNARLSALQASLECTRDQLAALDVRAALLALRAAHDELRAALATGGPALPARAELALLVEALDPMPVLSPLGSRVGRVQASFVQKTQEFAGFLPTVSASLAAVDTVLAALARLLSPVELLQQILLDPLRQLFSDRTFANTRELLLAFIDEMNPAQWRGELEGLVTAVRARLQAVVGDAVLGPVKESLRNVKATVDSLTIAPLLQSLDGAYAAVQDTVRQLDPSPLLRAMDEAYARILDLLQRLNPAIFVMEVDRMYRQDVIGVVRAISPEELLLPPLRELFERISGLLGVFDIQSIFAPVLGQLDELRGQLADGLERADTAYDGMLDALDAAAGAG